MKRIILGASLLLLSTTAAAADALSVTLPDWCECIPGTLQSAPGPGGCTLQRTCKQGDENGKCVLSVKNDLDDDGVVTIIPIKGYWTRWVEVCDDQGKPPQNESREK